MKIKIQHSNPAQTIQFDAHDDLRLHIENDVKQSPKNDLFCNGILAISFTKTEDLAPAKMTVLRRTDGDSDQENQETSYTIPLASYDHIAKSALDNHRDESAPVHDLIRECLKKHC